jgi:hypothetical protein
MNDVNALKAENERLRAELNGEVTIATFDITEDVIANGANTIALQNLEGMTKIDWGDGTINSSLEHTYSVGKYRCKVYNVTSIGDYAFRYCDSLTSVTIPDSVTSIGGEAFYNCSSLTEIAIPDSVTIIDVGAFGNCHGLKQVTIGSGVTNIGMHAFSTCDGLTNITIPDSVTSIGDWAFCNCSKLESITIGKNVTSIGDAVFTADGSLMKMVMRATTAPVIGTFGGETDAAPEKILVPKGCKEEYRTKWSAYANQIYEDCQYIIEVNDDGTLNIITI